MLSIFVHVIERLSSVVLTHGHFGQILFYLRILALIILFKINTGLILKTNGIKGLGVHASVLVYINKYRNGRRGKGVEALMKQKINVSLEIPLPLIR